jgi:hypothetical protein
MAKGISKNFMARMLFGLSFAAALLDAFSDNKLTPAELTTMFNQAFGFILGGGSITAADLQFVFNEDGSASMNFSAALVSKLNLEL